MEAVVVNHERIAIELERRMEQNDMCSADIDRFSENIADAWAAALIDIHQKRRGRDAKNEQQGTEECHENSSESPT